MAERGPSRYILPNVLTLSRPFIAYEASKAIRDGEKTKALTLTGLAALTDADGFVARRLDATSRFGEIVDPIADTAMRFLIFKELKMSEGTKTIKAISEIASSLINISLFIANKINPDIQPPKARKIAKIRFAVDAACATRLIAKPKDPIASWVIAGMSVLTAVDYINSARKTINGK